jgi:hypothetical protein
VLSLHRQGFNPPPRTWCCVNATNVYYLLIFHCYLSLGCLSLAARWADEAKCKCKSKAITRLLSRTFLACRVLPKRAFNHQRKAQKYKTLMSQMKLGQLHNKLKSRRVICSSCAVIYVAMKHVLLSIIDQLLLKFYIYMTR